MFVLQSNYDAVVEDRDYWKNQYDAMLEIKQLNNNNYKNKIKELEDKIETLYSEELENSEFEFDFKAVKAFSVERINRNGKPETIIGYIVNEAGNEIVKEWTFECSFTQHQKLVEQFKKIILKR